jgi:abortive infection bacteriophage resistance protein
MLIQDLVVIFDEMMSEVLNQRNQTAGEYPKSKIEKLTTYLDSTYKWSSYGCTELVAVRNVLAHNNGIWNKKSIDYVIPFIEKPPLEGDALSVGFSMLFYYRKAIRTFLNEVKIT